MHNPFVGHNSHACASMSVSLDNHTRALLFVFGLAEFGLLQCITFIAHWCFFQCSSLLLQITSGKSHHSA